jgi:hypothetical protein
MHAEIHVIHYFLQKSWQDNHMFFAMIRPGMTVFSNGMGKSLVKAPAP